MHLYITFIGVFLWLFFWLPVSLWLWFRLRRELPRRRWRPLASAALLALLSLGLPLWDVAWTGAQMSWYCSREAGVFVYRTVQAEGYHRSGLASAREARTLLEQGFAFVDGRDAAGQAVRYSLDGEEVLARPLAGPRSPYRLIGPLESPLSATVTRREWRLVDTRDGAVLGRDTAFYAHPGWMERGLVGRDRGAWRCDGPRGRSYAYSPGMEMSVLRPPPDARGNLRPWSPTAAPTHGS